MISLPPLAAKPLRLVLLGPPASGKGTQGRRLAESLKLSYLGTGVWLRQQMVLATDLGKQASPILARGEYLPDELICPILGDWLSQRSGGWVLDGFPRSLQQAAFLGQWLAQRGSKLDAAISLEISFLEALARIGQRVECADCHWSGHAEQVSESGECPSCSGQISARADDNDDNFRCRHAEFLNLTQPVIEHYRRLDLLCSCDATRSLDEVAAHLLEKLTVPTLF